jgi:hypothetical protein
MNSLGTEMSLELFPPATWSAQSVVDWEAADYPGLRPTGSWALDSEGKLQGLDPGAAGWRTRDTGECIDLSGRRLVLAYGSNPDPIKLLNRDGFFGGDSVIALRAAVFGWAAVWCRKRRQRDGAVVATLAPHVTRMEIHPVLALTPHQLDAMDDWEGHPTWYRRCAHRDPVLLESNRWAEQVEVYLGTAEKRPPLIDAAGSGGFVLCAEVPHAVVDRMVPR